MSKHALARKANKVKFQTGFVFAYAVADESALEHAVTALGGLMPSKGF